MFKKKHEYASTISTRFRLHRINGNIYFSYNIQRRRARYSGGLIIIIIMNMHVVKIL